MADTAPQISRDDLLDLVEYEKARDEIRDSAMAARKLRRVHVGEMVTIAFENVETVKYQIQEMMRAERMVDDDEIDFEISTYTGLLPGPSELSATLFIEIDDTPRLHEWLPKLVGIEDSVSLAIDGAGVAAAVGEEGRSKEDVTSTVHYLRFPLTAEQAQVLRAARGAELVIEHPNYRARTTLSPETVEALGSDIA